MSKVRPPYPAEFRQQMVELVRAGRAPAQLSREFGVTAQSITNWVGQAAIDEGKPLPGKEGLAVSSVLNELRKFSIVELSQTLIATDGQRQDITRVIEGRQGF